MTQSPQKREERSPLVVEITKDNEHMVSRRHKGMLKNPDGTFSRTHQYDTWNTNSLVQLKDYHESTPKMPEELLLTPHHPKPSRLKLGWSFDGEWVLVPKNSKDKGPDFTDYRIGRIERYIDTDGNIKRALSYGDEETKLIIWYRMDEMFQTFPQWQIPQPSRYYNGRKFNMEARRATSTKSSNKGKSKTSSQSQVPGDQSKDIQGKKGHRGGSANRGIGHYQPRGRGISTSRGGRRPSHKDPGWYKEYREWDEEQTSASGSGSRTHRDQQRWEEDPRSEYEYEGYGTRDYYRNPDQAHQSEGYGYFTTGYEDRKRARSPSPRRHRRRDYSPKYEYERGRGRGGRNYSPEDRSDRSDRSNRRYPSHDK